MSRLKELKTDQKLNKMNKLPIYRLVINDDIETGVDYVALVDEPAIEKYWMAFNKNEEFVKPEAGENQNDFMGRCISKLVGEGKDQDQAVAICYTYWDEEHKSNFSVQSQEKRIVAGPLMIADMPIYRRDARGEYYVVFDRQQIEKIALKYHKNKFTNNVNLMHDSTQKVDGVYLWQDFIIDRKLGVMPPKGYESLPDGSWFGFYKVDNLDVWSKVKSGEIKGFSVEGVFEHQYLVDKPQDELEALKMRFAELKKKIDQLIKDGSIS